MEISTLSILLLALDSGVHAFDEGPFQGWFEPAPETYAGSLPVTSDLIVYHDQNPNVSRSATFKPFENAWAELGPDSVLRNAEWTWRVNVSQFYAPCNGSDVAGPSDRQAFVSQTYDFSWSAEGNISEALDGATGPLCITQLNGWADLPVNVTNAITEDTSCVPALGQACVDAILNRTPTPSLEEGCKWGGSNGVFSNMPECRGSFGLDPALSETFGVGFSLGNMTNQINSGDTFWVNMSGPVLGNETWLYETVANQIQLLLFRTLLPTSTQPNASTVPGMELLCLRANNTKLPNVDFNKDGVALVGEVVLLSAGTSTVAGVDSLMYLGLVALIVAVVLG
ncbi:hypothetical protein E0Z10_g8020 [Xylaria hypoxylon]|uniref:Uncharacterized protein n=1 Tax=Xylaria hypoxylon TaxID=37992 RepID=A0A4Z0YTD4_9PEZI|nr:hypothetical protein E0Z10_g8020 [Xylaria hypoxylon]